MKKFTIEVSHASPQQLATIGLELKIMSKGWTKYGPRITINKRALEAPELHAQATNKRAKHKRHNMARFI